MTSSRTESPIGDDKVAASVGQVLEAKLHRPRQRDSWVWRERLIDALDRAVRCPVTLVAAPAGYGKTTLLAQWLEDSAHPATAWVSLDSDDNDPDRLWTHVAAALERASCVPPAASRSRMRVSMSTCRWGLSCPHW